MKEHTNTKHTKLSLGMKYVSERLNRKRKKEKEKPTKIRFQTKLHHKNYENYIFIEIFLNDKFSPNKKYTKHASMLTLT